MTYKDDSSFLTNQNFLKILVTFILLWN